MLLPVTKPQRHMSKNDRGRVQRVTSLSINSKDGYLFPTARLKGLVNKGRIQSTR